MPKRASARPAAATADEADPRFLPVVEALAKIAGFSLMESKSRAMRGLMLNGKSFGMSSHGRLILKLTDERALALILDRVGKPFSASPGRTLKGWIEVTRPDADWVALALEACGLAQAGKPAARVAKWKRRPRRPT